MPTDAGTVGPGPAAVQVFPGADDPAEDVDLAAEDTAAVTL